MWRISRNGSSSGDPRHNSTRTGPWVAASGALFVLLSFLAGSAFSWLAHWLATVGALHPAGQRAVTAAGR